MPKKPPKRFRHMASPDDMIRALKAASERALRGPAEALDKKAESDTGGLKETCKKLEDVLKKKQ